MNQGSLVRINFSSPRMPHDKFGIVLKEIKGMSVENRFFHVILTDGKIRLFSDRYLELIE